MGTGSKIQIDTDYAGAGGPTRFRLERHYSTVGLGNKLNLGVNWRLSLDRRISIDTSTFIGVYRPEGAYLYFKLVASQWVADPNVADRFAAILDGGGNIIGGQFINHENDEIESYDASGRLQAIATREGLTQTFSYGAGDKLTAVTDSFGKTLSVAYDASGRVASVTDPAGGIIAYGYDANNNLASVTYPDGKTRSYHYENSGFPNNLTGITDENGGRYSTYTYDSTGRALASTLAGGVDSNVVTYTSVTGNTSVADPLGAIRTYTATNFQGVFVTRIVSQPCSNCTVPVWSTVVYDGSGNAVSQTDFNGRTTTFTHDTARILETSRTEASATPQSRKISTEWHPAFRLVKRMAEPLRLTTYVYNGDSGASCGFKADGTTLVPGVWCSKTMQATTDASGTLGFGATLTGTPRSWSYTYNANGNVLTVDGPRIDVADVTTYTYYANNDPDLGKRGNIATITNAAGQTTQITSYNAHGQPLSIVDPNGLTTTLAYDARQRLTSRNVGGEITTYAYDNAGQLTTVTLPDTSFLSYTYDAAHRLTAIQDNLGNRIAYTLDLAGNRTQEQVFDPANALAQTRSRVYNNLNRLIQDIGAASQTTAYVYDTQGNLTSIDGPLAGTADTTTNTYDALNRLTRVTNPNAGQVNYSYNGQDALTQVIDPRSLVTGYTVDGLGNLTQQASPDSGNTVNTYDVAGNLLTQTDAKGQVTAYVYDALNRVTLITFHDGSKQAYAYDQGANGVGRLSSITETNSALQVTSLIAYAYDQKGRVTSETRSVGGVSYLLSFQFDLSGRLAGLTYPSGRTVTYGFDALGRVNQVTTTKDSQSLVVVQNVQYHPFGGAKSWTLGNGQVYSRTVDQDGRIASYTLGTANYTIGFDAASRITAIAQAGNPANSNTYGYDLLDRLTSAILPSSNFGYGYDAVGNRLTKTIGANTDAYTYGSTSNRIATLTPFGAPPRSFVLDANGSTTDDALNTYAYDTRGRMVQATSASGTTSYQVNALGQRVRKTNSQGDRVFHYDTSGRLIAESDPAGAVKRELIYLGDLPVVVIQ